MCDPACALSSEDLAVVALTRKHQGHKYIPYDASRPQSGRGSMSKTLDLVEFVARAFEGGCV